MKAASSQRSLWVALTLIVPAALLLLGTLNREIAGRQRFNLHLRNETFMSMNRAARFMQDCDVPAESFAVLRLINECKYEGVADVAITLAEYLEGSADSGRVYDVWGNPVMLTKDSNGNPILLSAGPNQKYEAGRSDDITVTIGP